MLQPRHVLENTGYDFSTYRVSLAAFSSVIKLIAPTSVNETPSAKQLEEILQKFEPICKYNVARSSYKQMLHILTMIQPNCGTTKRWSMLKGQRRLYTLIWGYWTIAFKCVFEF
jgi:hypothetical protein